MLVKYFCTISLSCTEKFNEHCVQITFLIYMYINVQMIFSKNYYYTYKNLSKNIIFKYFKQELQSNLTETLF